MSIWKLWVDATSSRVSNAIVMGFVLISLILIAVYIAGWVRRLALGEDGEPSNPFAHIDQLRDEGQISQEEYQRMKKLISENLKADILLATKGGGKNRATSFDRKFNAKHQGLGVENRAETPTQTEDRIDFVVEEDAGDEEKEQL